MPSEFLPGQQDWRARVLAIGTLLRRNLAGSFLTRAADVLTHDQGIQRVLAIAAVQRRGLAAQLFSSTCWVGLAGANASLW